MKTPTGTSIVNISRLTDFSTLINDVADESRTSLASVLMRAKLLAVRMNSQVFREWVDLELDGYRDDEPLPDYRVISPMLLADFCGPFGRRTINVPLSLEKFLYEVQNSMGRHRFYENIGEIESMLESNSETFHRHFTFDVVELVRAGPAIRVRNQEMQSIQSVFPKSVFRGVLQAIRKRLLDLLVGFRDKYPELEQDMDAVANVSQDEVSKIVDRIIYNNCTIIEEPRGDVQMGDRYETGQAGAVGPNAPAHDNTFNQIWNQNGSNIDLVQLASDLELLASEMKERASEAEHQVAIGNVEAARQAAEDGDGPKALEFLRAAGRWVAEVARDIGTSVAAKAISTAVGS